MSNFAPVLVTGFNRPDFLNLQIERLVKLNCKIYVSLDVPKSDDLFNQEFSRNCLEVVDAFRDKLQDVRISETNLGCDLGITTAISWAFEKESALIILEDDVRTEQGFLEFATLALHNFRDNEDIGSIAGCNFAPTEYLTDPASPFRLSAFSNSWGWATWRNRWNDYLEDRDSFPNFTFNFPDNFWSFSNRSYWRDIFKQTETGDFDAWDFKWLYSNWRRKRLTLTSNKNLVLNIGFDSRATHTTNSIIPSWLPLEFEQFDGTLEPKTIPKRDVLADNWVLKNHFKATLRFQVINRLARKYPRLSKFYKKIQLYFGAEVK
jgi:hypothetical protein